MAKKKSTKKKSIVSKKNSIKRSTKPINSKPVSKNRKSTKKRSKKDITKPAHIEATSLEKSKSSSEESLTTNVANEPQRTKPYRKLSWIPDRSDIRDHLFIAKPITRPPQLSLQAHCSPIKDQADLGCCTGFGIVGNVEMLNPGFRGSELFVYYNERVVENDVSEDAGAEIRDGIKVAAKYGVCKEHTWPYVTKMFAHKPPQTAYDEATKFQITQYLRVEGLENICNCIAQGFPVIMGTTWYDVYDTPEVERTGIMPVLTKDAKAEGGHCMLIVGYDDVNQRLTVRNSWGTSWGAQGYCYFPYSTVSQFDDMWTIRGEERG